MNKQKTGSLPNEAQKEFLKLSYNKFYDIFEEIFENDFWEQSDWYRFSKTKEQFSIYAELLSYLPIQWTIEYLKKLRPPMEAEIASELFKFVRNLLTHFPFFDKWDDVYITKNLANWSSEKKQIDNFLEKYKGKQTVKYRFWEQKTKKMTYLSIKFPKRYGNNKTFLKEILSEKEGVKFSFILMKNILDSQVVGSQSIPLEKN